jgi:hypothetical protein
MNLRSKKLHLFFSFLLKLKSLLNNNLKIEIMDKADLRLKIICKGANLWLINAPNNSLKSAINPEAFRL